MKRIMNTFKYGSKETKGLLAVTFLAGLAAAGLVVTAIVTHSLLFFFGAIICAFVTISLAQTFGIREEGTGGEMPVTDTREALTMLRGVEPEENTEEENTEEENTEEEKPEEEKPEEEKTEEENTKKKKTKEKKTKKKKSKEEKTKEEKTKEENTKEENTVEENTKKKKTKAMKMKASPSKEQKKEEQKTEDGLPEEEIKEPPQPLQTSEDFAQYNRKKVKKILHKYKVKRVHRLVLIDKCEEFSIYQTPAYIWVADNLLHLLLIEKEPRHLALSVLNIHEITYLKKQTANEDVDYAAFKGKGILADLFRPYLPDYVHSTVVDDLSAYKNLYGIGPGIYFTNRSASSLFDLLAVDFVVEDKVTTSTRANIYFKNAYKANILLRDNVIDANGYADRISNILDSMAHSTMSNSEFKETMNLMQKNKFITAEFATYYMGVRDKI